MKWNNHSGLNNMHAFLSPSSPHWLNYDADRLRQVYANHRMATMGSRVHKVAEELITLNIRLPKTKASLNCFVNDSIGFDMQPEQVLFFSENAFGTADSVGFVDNVLRIFDLKTGVTPGKVEQLEVYTAYFCLEYNINPNDIETDLRIYQFDEVVKYKPEPITILNSMQTIRNWDDIIKEMRLNG